MKRGVIFGICIVIGAILVASWLRQSGSPPGALHQPNREVQAFNEVMELEARQAEWNRLFWGPELEAQRHEEYFIQFWDDLRLKDPFAVASQAAFDEIVLPGAGAITQRENGVERRVFSGSNDHFSHSQWLDKLKKWKEEGYKLEQSEWRHIRFDPGTTALSVFQFRLDLLGPLQSARFVVRGKVAVTWKEPTAGKLPALSRIEIQGLEILKRAQPASFEKVLGTTITPNRGTRYIDPVIVADLNRDGFSEIILASKNLLVENKGQGRFALKTLCAVPPPTPYTAILAEVTSDGERDLIFADHLGLQIYRGTGRMGFDSPERIPLASLQNPFVMTAADIDGDNDLDLFLAQYKLPYVEGQMPEPYFDANDGFPAYLLLNDGSGRFTDVTLQRGLGMKRFRRTYSASLVDLNRDAAPDLLVVSDFAGIDFYLNDGRGFFIDQTKDRFSETHLFGMAHSIADFDGDAELDLFAVGMQSATAQRLDHLKLGIKGRESESEMRRPMTFGNRLYFSKDSRFLLTPQSEQVADGGWAWGIASFDFDNDGDLDIYLANGHKSGQSVRDYCPQFWCHDIYAGSSQTNHALNNYFQSVARKIYGRGASYGGYDKNRLFINENGNSFFEVAYLFGVASEKDCRSVVAEDLDRDGRLDLILTTSEIWPVPQQTLEIWRNVGINSNSWISFGAEQSALGYFPPGMELGLKSVNGLQKRIVVNGEGFRSQHNGLIHFGLGRIQLEEVVQVEIKWPGKDIKILPGLKPNQFYSLQ